MSTESAPQIPRTEAAVQPYRPYEVDVTPHYRLPVQAPLSGPVELYAENDPVVWVPDAYGQMVPMRRSAAPAAMQPMPPRDLTPQPLFDVRAQRIAAGGILAAGTGWGIGQALAPLAGISAGALMWLAIAIVAWKIAPAAAGPKVENHTHVSNHNKWFGRSTTTVNH
ncbi:MULTISPECIES: hypothetical protein [Streptomyces]|uniref:hypothetical protein n=1 Tax=Streptomyces TaxID=1883 RepID=UPI00025CE10B|nr:MULTISPECIES: hypothetical protein [Streptomyces]EIF87900.1 hypothetical protein [Streptomyces tsukubensis NRRL18488]